MRQDPHRDAVNLFQGFAAHQLRGRSLSDHLTAAQRNKIIAVARRHIDIMQYGDHRQPPLLAEAMAQRYAQYSAEMD